MYSSRNAKPHNYFEDFKNVSKTLMKSFLKRQCRRAARRKNKILTKQEIE
jgi:hypothetical protein